MPCSIVFSEIFIAQTFEGYEQQLNVPFFCLSFFSTCLRLDNSCFGVWGLQVDFRLRRDVVKTASKESERSKLWLPFVRVHKRSAQVPYAKMHQIRDAFYIV